jgi:hypothetical protein
VRGASLDVRDWTYDAISHLDVSFLWDHTTSRGRQLRDRVSEALADLDLDLPDTDVPFPNVDLPDVPLPTCSPAMEAHEGRK